MLTASGRLLACLLVQSAWVSAHVSYPHHTSSLSKPEIRLSGASKHHQLLKTQDTPDASSAHRILRLRGGAPPMIEKAKAQFNAISPVVRGWVACVVFFTIAATIGLVEPEHVGLNGDEMVKKFQIWRPFTSGVFFGKFNPNIMIKVISLIQFGQELERSIGTEMFLRALVSSLAMITAAAHALGLPFTGDALSMAVTHICTRRRPNQPASYFGVKIAYKFLPLAMMGGTLLFQQQVPVADFAGMVAGQIWHIIYCIQAVLRQNAEHLKANPKGRTLGGGGKPGSKLFNSKRFGSVVTDEKRKAPVHVAAGG